MEITEVRIFPRESEDRKLRAYATITIDNAFVVRNVKVIEGNKGLFVAMPSRKLKESCPKCRHKNAVKSKFCNQCGTSLPSHDRPAMAEQDMNGKQSDHRDIAHPITPECRDYIQKKVLGAYDAFAKEGSGRAHAPAPAPAPMPTPDSRTSDSHGRGVKAAEHPAQSDSQDFEGDLEL